MQGFRNSKPSWQATLLLWLSFALMRLLTGVKLTGCAVSSQSLNERPKAMPIESVIDVSRLESDVKMLPKELQGPLNFANRITNK
ncbi:hypothetical protein [Turicimonas muris]|uniref:hypothetical protein n=1 Tax=Turicimonas muris TaxID=1796652 RepID=UPI0024954D9A|nr:hypothetical protein [Turicimonas muris]